MISAAIQQLYDEHEAIVSAIEQCRSLLTVPHSESAEASLRSLIAFFREYGDGYHHRKEEEYLFPLLAAANFTMEALTMSLSEHHTEFRDALASAERSLDKHDWAAAQSTVASYLDDLYDHIGAENDELFVVADELLSEVEKDRLYYQFMDGDRELGEERKRELEEEVHNA